MSFGVTVVYVLVFARVPKCSRENVETLCGLTPQGTHEMFPCRGTHRACTPRPEVLSVGGAKRINQENVGIQSHPQDAAGGPGSPEWVLDPHVGSRSLLARGSGASVLGFS